MANIRKPFVSQEVEERVKIPFALNERKEKVRNENDRSFLDDMPSDVIRYIGTFLKKNKDKATLAILCKTTNNFFQPDLEEAVFNQLLQSVVDGEKNTIQKILAKMPEFLLRAPKRGQVIESQLTWQRFSAEKPLEMATKRKQREVIEWLLPYFEELETRGLVEDGTKEALKQWKVPELPKEAKEELMQKYAAKMKALIDVIAKETFPNGTNKGRLIDRISEETKTKFAEFRQELLTLDNDIDVELLLIAGCQAYIDHFGVFQNWNQRDLYCIATTGFKHGLLTPELGKVLCESLVGVVEQNKAINDRASEYKVFPGREFLYRSSRDSHSGAGYDFFCRILWYGDQVVGQCSASRDFGKLCRAKEDELGELKRQLKSGNLPKHKPNKKLSCVIQCVPF